MNKICRSVCIFIVLVCCLSGVSFAQGLGSLSFPPGIIPPGFDASRYLGGFSSLDEIGFSKPKLMVGYLNGGRGLAISGDILHIQLGPWYQELPFDFSADVPLYGVWVGLTEEILLGGPNKGLTLHGRYLLPTNEEFQSTLYNYGWDKQQPEIRRWDSETERWYVDGALFYKFGASVSAMAGLRFDYHNVTLDDPQFIEYITWFGSAITSLPDQEACFNLQNWAPYLGLTVDLSSGNSILKVSAKGFPWLATRHDWGMTTDDTYQRYSQDSYPTSSHFFETSLEYGRPFFEGALLSLFAEWNYFEASAFTTDVEHAPSTDIAAKLPADFSLRRSEITVGGNLTLDFTLPF